MWSKKVSGCFFVTFFFLLLSLLVCYSATCKSTTAHCHVDRICDAQLDLCLQHTWCKLAIILTSIFLTAISISSQFFDVV